MRQHGSNELLGAALAFAERGWYVFPLVPGAKTPVISKEEGGQGYKDATTDKAIIRQWWKRRPRVNIGIAVAASHLVLVDVDHKDGTSPGLESWHDLLQEHGQAIADTVTQETPSGGLHVLYGAHGAPIANTKDVLGPGLEVKASSGYFVACPSVFEGKPYSWALGYAPDEHELLPFPDCLRALLKVKDAPVAAQPPIRSGGDTILEGARNATLASLAGSLRRRGLGREAIESALLGVNRAACQPPLDEAEVRRIAISISRYSPPGDGSLGPMVSQEEIPLINALQQGDKAGIALALSQRLGSEVQGVKVWRTSPERVFLLLGDGREVELGTMRELVTQHLFLERFATATLLYPEFRQGRRGQTSEWSLVRQALLALAEAVDVPGTTERDYLASLLEAYFVSYRPVDVSEVERIRGGKTWGLSFDCTLRLRGAVYIHLPSFGV